MISGITKDRRYKIMNENLNTKALDDSELENVSGGRAINVASRVPTGLVDSGGGPTDQQVEEAFKDSIHYGPTIVLRQTIKYIAGLFK